VRLPILTYHNIGAAPAGARMPKLYVTQQAFARQCRVLRALGLRGVSMGEGLQALRAGRNGVVVLTFDDGYVDNFTHALPVLQEFGFTATCYVVAGLIGSFNAWDIEYLGVRKSLMNVDQLRAWRAAGQEIGSHTLTHPRLTSLNESDLSRELCSSKAALEQMLGEPVPHFCYPYGDESESVRRAVAAAGYESAVSTRRGLATERDDLHALPRVSINGGKGLLRFALKVATPYANLRREAVA
jgi:peptidoglycan/xylan/chitin deacetylase (PgdA/CDA1 family)